MTTMIIPLHPQDQDGLIFSKEDCDDLRFLVERTGFAARDPKDVIQTFSKYASGQLLTKEGFDRAIRRLVPRKKLDTEARQKLSIMLSAAFIVFDRKDTNSVDLTEFVSGFTIFCAKAKSAKLLTAFDLFDDDDDGMLTRRQLWRFLRSFLSTLFSLSRAASSDPVVECHRRIDDTAVEATQLIFSQLQSPDTKHISFDDFAGWYNAGGSKLLPWLELLDLKKWPGLADVVSASASKEPATADTVEEEAVYQDNQGAKDSEPVRDADDNDGEGVLQFELPTGSVLSFSQDDVDQFLAMVELSCLDQMPPSDAVGEFAKASKEGLLSYEAFSSTLMRLLFNHGRSDLDNDQVDAVTGALSGVFYSFDTYRAGEVEAVEFVTGFSMLCSGSKSEKLSLSFRLFDTENVGGLARRSLWRLLRSYLVVLFSASQQCSGFVSSKSTRDEIDKAAVDAVASVFMDSDRATQDSITFEEFGKWYNDGGFEAIPWLELLDLTKWPRASVDKSAAQEAPEAPHEGEEAPSSPSEPVFQFSLSKPLDTLEYSANDCLLVHKLSRVMGFAKLSLEDVMNALQEQSFHDLLDLDGVDRALKTIGAHVTSEDIPSLDSHDKHTLSRTLMAVISAYDRDDDGYVDLDALSAGLSFLCDGSKSEKLFLLWKVFDHNGDGLLTRMELWRFLKAVLVAIVAIHRGIHDASPTHSKVVDDSVNAVVVNVVLQVFKEAGDGVSGSSLALKDFAEWYNSGGYEQIPWVELLDLKKWPVDPSQLSARQRRLSVDNLPGLDEDEESDDSGDDATVFEFQLPTINAEEKSYASLRITETDCDNMRLLTQSTGLSKLPAAAVYAAVVKHSNDCTVLKEEEFEEAIGELVPAIGNEERTFLMNCLRNMFSAFDRDGDNSVDVEEFAAGLSLLASGTKSEKLSLAFRALDIDDDGYLTKLELWSFIRAVLTGIVALRHSPHGSVPVAATQLIASASVEVAHSVFDSANKKTDSGISFEEFGQWYNNGGYETMPWLELLDLRKWDAVAPSKQTAAAARRAREERGVEGTDQEEDAASSPPCRDSDIIFEFQVTGLLHPSQQGEDIQCTGKDLKRAERLVQGSGLFRCSALHLQRMLQWVANERDMKDTLSKDDFTLAMSVVLKYCGQPSEISWAIETLQHFYDMFAEDELGGEAKVAELSAGLTVLAGGRKSDKLHAAFQAISATESLRLTPNEFAQFLLSILRALLELLAPPDTPERRAALRSLSQRCAMEVGTMVEAETPLGAPDGTIAFDQFGQWYNDGGYEVVPWLELLDLRKWPFGAAMLKTIEGNECTMQSAGDVSEEDEEGEVARATAEDKDDDTRGENSADFDLPVSTGSLKLRARFYDAVHWQLVLMCSGLERKSFQEFVGAFETFAEEGVLDRAQFDACMESLMGDSAAAVTASVDLDVSDALQRLFTAFDTDGNGRVDAREFSVGISLLAPGPKSEKLCRMFKLFEDEKGYISRGDLWSFFRGILLMLASIASFKAKGRSLHEQINDTSSLLASFVFREADTNRDGRIQFKDFAQWYNNGGYSYAPWIELLSLKKWPGMGEGAGSEEEVAGGRDANSSGGDSTGQIEGTSGKPASKGEDTPIFSFPVLAGEALVFRASDLERLGGFLNATGLHRCSVPSLYRALLPKATTARNGRCVMDMETFDKRMVQLLRPPSSSEERERMVASLHNFFSKYDRSDSMQVDAHELVSGLSVFCGGSKSEKLTVAFDAMGDGEGVGRGNLAKYLRGLVTGILAHTSYAQKMSKGELREMVDAIVDNALRAVVPDDKREATTLEEFGQWYNSGKGFQEIPWLELLDLWKWATLSTFVKDLDASKTSMGAGKDDSYDGHIDPSARFTFVLSETENLVLRISGRDIWEFLKSIHRDALTRLSSQRLLDAVTQAIEEQACGFDTLEFHTNQLLDDMGHLSARFPGQMVDCLEALEPESIGADPWAKVVAFCLVCSGRKSEKLAHVFKAVSQDGSSRVTRDELLTIVGGFLWGLVASVSAVQPSEERLGKLAPEEIDAAARELVQKIWVEAGRSVPERLSFEEFGQWYNDGGFESAAWIELLDCNKWQAMHNEESEAEEEASDDDEQPAKENGAPGAGEAAASGSDSDMAVCRFSLMSNRSQRVDIEVTKDDVASTRKLLQLTHFHHHSSGEALAEAKKQCGGGGEDGLLDRNGFLTLLRTLSGRTISKITDRGDKMFVDLVLSGLFYAFDRESIGSAPPEEVGTALSVLCAGRKSEKLQSCFAAFAENGGTTGEDTFLEEPDLARFLTSLLCGLVCLLRAFADDADSVVSAARETGSIIAADVFKDTGANERVSFAQFGEWYNGGGYEVVPWLELLDLSKWDALPVAGEAGTLREVQSLTSRSEGSQHGKPKEENKKEEKRKGEEHVAAAHEAALADEDDDDSDLPMFYLPLVASVLSQEAPLAPDNSFAFSLSMDDVAAVFMTVSTSKLGLVPAEEVANEFRHRSKDGVLPKSGFDKAIRRLVPGENMSQSGKVYLSMSLSTLFYAFDREGTEQVSLAEFATGFSLLCAGNKSEKLALGFKLFSGAEEPHLHRANLFRFLRAFLTAIAIHSSNIRASPDLANILDKSCALYAERIWSDTSHESEEGISFDQFGEWYNTQGFEVMPWLELLELRKWPWLDQFDEYQGSDSDDSDYVPGEDGEEEEEEEEEDEEEGDDNDEPSEDDEEEDVSNAEEVNADSVFEFHIGSEPLIFYTEAVGKVRRLAEGTGLAHVSAMAPAKAVKTAFEDPSIDCPVTTADATKVLEAISAASGEELREDADATKLSLQYIRRLISLIGLSSASDSSDDSEDVAAPLGEVMCGLMLLCGGKKSEKLASMFQLLDTARQGALDQDQLCTLVRGILFSLVALTEEDDVSDKRYVPAAQALASAMFSVVQQYVDAEIDTISYEKFGEWYNNWGYELIPWLELLDLRKWRQGM